MDNVSQNKRFDDVVIEYFRYGYEYSVICQLLEEKHSIKISERHLKRHLKRLSLKRKCYSQQELAVAESEASDMIDILLTGPSANIGYRSCWHLLRMAGVNLPQCKVSEILRQKDPNGVELRSKQKLRRRVYQNLGPNASWHMDGYDKLKPFGFAVHGGIDGFSRKILWLNVSRSNNCPKVIAQFYTNAVREFHGCPKQLVSDLGTENGISASMQCFFHRDIGAHCYVPSPRNQRIEAWWSIFSKLRCLWWRDFFRNLEDRRILNLNSGLHKECLWFCFSDYIQSDFDTFKSYWNTHKIRKSRYDTVAGVPNVIYDFPQNYNGHSSLIKPVSAEDLNEAINSLSVPLSENEYQDYFEYAKEELRLVNPKNWTDCLNNFVKIVESAENN